MASSDQQIDLEAIQSTLIDVAKRAGQLILSAKPVSASGSGGGGGGGGGGGNGPGTKKNSADLVTETDRAVEAMISATLLSQYPTFSFLGEETYQPGMKLGPEPTFVVDPIDGTTNFVHGWPYVSVSLGFAVARVPHVGVVYNPFSGKLYAGIKGRGSYLFHDDDDAGGGGSKGGNRQRLPLKRHGERPEELHGLDGTLVAIEWGSDRSGNNWKTKCETWRKLGASKEDGGAMVHSARALGSAALNLCAVAEGTIDVYWEGGCWAWDVCAGWVILTEAGGIIVDGNPTGVWEIPVDHRKYLAVRGAGNKDAADAQKRIVQEFWSYIDGTMDYES